MENVRGRDLPRRMRGDDSPGRYRRSAHPGGAGPLRSPSWTAGSRWTDRTRGSDRTPGPARRDRTPGRDGSDGSHRSARPAGRPRTAGSHRSDDHGTRGLRPAADVTVQRRLRFGDPVQLGVRRERQGPGRRARSVHREGRVRNAVQRRLVRIVPARHLLRLQTVSFFFLALGTTLSPPRIRRHSSRIGWSRASAEVLRQSSGARARLVRPPREEVGIWNASRF